MDKKLKQIKNEALELCAPVFHEMEEISLYNTQKVLEAFRKHHLSAYHLRHPTAMAMMIPAAASLKRSGATFSNARRLLSVRSSSPAPMP